MPTILIAESDEQLATRFKQASADAGITEIVMVKDLGKAAEEMRLTPPAVLLVGPLLADDEAFNLATTAADSFGTSTVIVAPTVNESLLRRAMRAGVSDVRSVSDPIGELKDAIESAAEAAYRRRAVMAPVQEASDAGNVKGTLITVFSTKGGVGKTVLSTNLGVVLAQKTGKRVALVDLDLEFGDVGIMLGLKPDRTIANVVQVFDRLDADLLEGHMVKHSTGLKVLLAPVRPEDAEGVSAGRISQVLDLLKESFDYIVVDTSPSFSEVLLVALDKSDLIYALTMMDVASIKNTRISLQKLSQLGYDSGRLGIVLNRADSKVLLQPDEVERAIGGRINVHIPSDRVVPRSVNKGVPVVIDMPKSGVARSIVTLAEEITGSGEKEADDVA